MLIKSSSIELSQRRFQRASIYRDHKAKTYVSLGFIKPLQHKYKDEDEDEDIDVFQYKTFIRINEQLRTIPKVNLFDVQPLIKETESEENTIMLFYIQPNNIELFLQENHKVLGDRWVNLIEDKPYDAKILSPKIVLKISQNMNRLQTENLKWNQQNCNITSNCVQNHSKFVIKKQIRNDCIFDIEDTSYSSSFITSISPIYEYNVLFHLGRNSNVVCSNFTVINYDIDYHQTNWKYNPPRYEFMMNKAVFINNKKTFINGCHNTDDHSCSLKLFDFRTSGAVANLLNSNTAAIIQLQHSQTRGYSITPNFQYLNSLHNKFEIMTLLSYKVSAMSFPCVIDIRKPQNVLPLKLSSHFSHLRAISANDVSKIITVQRQYNKNFEFQSAQLNQYQLNSIE